MALHQQYDLTSRIAAHLDRHLVFPLLEFLQERQQYPDDEILKAKIELLSETNMVDYAGDIHKSLYHTEEVPKGEVSPSLTGRWKVPFHVVSASKRDSSFVSLIAWCVGFWFITSELTFDS